MSSIEKAYGDPEVPLKSYALLILIFTAVFASLYALLDSQGLAAQKIGSGEFVYLSVASYKLARVVTMSFIASPIRAFFAKRGESLKGGEVQDESRGQGLQKAIGNLVTCPFCFNVWAATFFTFGYSFFPDMTFKLAQILCIAALGDLLHFAYRNIREKSE